MAVPAGYSPVWTRGGFGWIIALIVLFVWILVLLNAIHSSDSIIAASFIGLSLALLV